MKRCVECSLVLPLDLFLGENQACNLCLVAGDKLERKAKVEDHEFTEMPRRWEAMFMAQPKPRPR